MAQHEKLRHALLTEQPRCNSTGYVTYRAFELSLRFGIPEPHVREIMGEMANDGLIWLAAYDGTRDRIYQDWSDKQQFFDSPLDGGHVKVKVRARGAELASVLPKSTIGFVST